MPAPVLLLATPGHMLHNSVVSQGVPVQAGDVTLPVRILHLPMAFNEKWTHGAIQKYMRSVRSEGPYLPSNVDFVAANNGLTGNFCLPCLWHVMYTMYDKKEQERKVYALLHHDRSL